MKRYLELIEQFQSDESVVFPPAVGLELSWRSAFPRGTALAAGLPIVVEWVSRYKRKRRGRES